MAANTFLTVDLSTNQVRESLASGSTTTATISGFEHYKFGSLSMHMVGTGATDVFMSQDGKSILEAHDGENWITADAVGPTTIAGMNSNPSWTQLIGGNGIDHITTMRAAVITGGSGDDIITGSAYGDEIHASAKPPANSGITDNDVVDSGAGADVFFAGDLQGIDKINAGVDQDKDVFLANPNMNEFYFGETDLGELVIQKYTNGVVGPDAMIFMNLDEAHFNGGYGAYDFHVSDALAKLSADADHYMTGLELMTALQADHLLF